MTAVSNLAVASEHAGLAPRWVGAVEAAAVTIAVTLTIVGVCLLVPWAQEVWTRRLLPEAWFWKNAKPVLMPIVALMFGSAALLLGVTVAIATL